MVGKSMETLDIKKVSNVSFNGYRCILVGDFQGI